MTAAWRRAIAAEHTDHAELDLKVHLGGLDGAGVDRVAVAADDVGELVEADRLGRHRHVLSDKCQRQVSAASQRGRSSAPARQAAGWLADSGWRSQGSLAMDS